MIQKNEIPDVLFENIMRLSCYYEYLDRFIMLILQIVKMKLFKVFFLYYIHCKIDN